MSALPPNADVGGGVTPAYLQLVERQQVVIQEYPEVRISVNALFLKDLAQKTRCGLRGRGGDDLELAILEGLKDSLMEPALFEEFAREFTAEVNRQRSSLVSERQALQASLDRTSWQIDKLVEAIIEGADALALNDRLKLLEKQRVEIEAKIAAIPEATSLLHPGLANIYRKAVAELHTLVRNPETIGEAFGLIRGLIDAVLLMPVDGKLEIELRGDLVSILALSDNGRNKAFSAREKALQIKMVAGTGFEPVTFRL